MCCKFVPTVTNKDTLENSVVMCAAHVVSINETVISFKMRLCPKTKNSCNVSVLNQV